MLRLFWFNLWDRFSSLLTRPRYDYLDHIEERLEQLARKREV